MTPGLSLIPLQHLGDRYRYFLDKGSSTLVNPLESFRFQPTFKRKLSPTAHFKFIASWRDSALLFFLSQTLHFPPSLSSSSRYRLIILQLPAQKKMKLNIDASTSSTFVAVASQRRWHYTTPSFVRRSIATSMKAPIKNQGLWGSQYGRICLLKESHVVQHSRT